jgi:hypothetical protein
LIGVAALGIVVAGCEATKSENPLSPNIAGPIAGVGITAPEPVSPAQNAEVPNTDPLRLTWGNSTTNSVRPLWYVVEIAADSNFATKVYTNGKVLPQEGERTSMVVESRLTAEATYFWRVRAVDGANNSEYSFTSRFAVIIPVSLGAPTAVSPVNGQTVTNLTPLLTVNNGSVTGRAGPIEVRFHVATDQAFTNIVSVFSSAQGGGATTSAYTPTLAANTLYYWRAYSTNGPISSPVSSTQSFRTPAAAPGGGGGGGGVPPPPAGGNRTPDPAPGQRLPLPNMSFVVNQIASQFPGALANSCPEHGGTWEFMDRVVNELRKYDTRWGYNGKRGNANDPSFDVVDYHYGPGPDEGSTDVYIIDIIGGHCGSSPQPGWGDVTDVTRQNGTIGRWISRGRF